MVLEKIISKSQNAFIRGRQILDHVLFANECLNGRIRYEEPVVLCKLDLEKAYDHVNWDFSVVHAEDVRFWGKWCSWITHCIFTVRLWAMGFSFCL
jgi:hypothetical protein